MTAPRRAPTPEDLAAENFQQVFERSPRRAAQACFPRYPASSVGIDAHDTITIKQDKDGRYCLNDLHKAAGGNPNDRPEQWFRNKNYKDLANQLFIEANCANLRIKPMESHRGRNGGTYVCKELVYAYAMWVSPAFHLKVSTQRQQRGNAGIPAVSR